MNLPELTTDNKLPAFAWPGGYPIEITDTQLAAMIEEQNRWLAQEEFDRWGIDTGRAFDIKGIWQYGRTVTNADSHAHALELAVSWDCDWNDEAFTFIAPAVLTVYQVGPKYEYMRSHAREFQIVRGLVQEVTK